MCKQISLGLKWILRYVESDFWGKGFKKSCFFECGNVLLRCVCTLVFVT